MSAFTETSTSESTQSNRGLFSQQDSFLPPENESLELNVTGERTRAGESTRNNTGLFSQQDSFSSPNSSLETIDTCAYESNKGLFNQQDSFSSPKDKSLKLNTIGGYTCSGQSDDISMIDFSALQAAGICVGIDITNGNYAGTSTDRGAGDILKAVIDSITEFMDSFFGLMVMLPNMVINDDNTWEVPSNLVQLGYIAADGGTLTQTEGYVTFNELNNTYSPDNTRNANGYPVFTDEQWERIISSDRLNIIRHWTNSGRRYYLQLPYMLFHAIKLK